MTGDSTNEDNGTLLYCSFCGKSQNEVRKLKGCPEGCSDAGWFINRLVESDLLAPVRFVHNHTRMAQAIMSVADRAALHVGDATVGLGEVGRLQGALLERDRAVGHVGDVLCRQARGHDGVSRRCRRGARVSRLPLIDGAAPTHPWRTPSPL